MCRDSSMLWVSSCNLTPFFFIYFKLPRAQTQTHIISPGSRTFQRGIQQSSWWLEPPTQTGHWSKGQHSLPQAIPVLNLLLPFSSSCFMGCLSHGLCLWWLLSHPVWGPGESFPSHHCSQKTPSKPTTNTTCNLCVLLVLPLPLYVSTS